MPRYLSAIALLILVISLAFLSTASSRGPDTSTRTLDAIKSEVTAKLDLDNPYIADTAMTMAADYPGEYSINQVSQIYNTMAQGGWYYVNDPSGSESYQNANLSLQKGKIKNTIGMGDCDDFAILMASLIQSIGGSARVVFAYDDKNQSAHAYVELYLGENGTLGVNEISRWLKNEYEVDDLPGINKTGNEVWLNLDWGDDITKAAYPGGSYFGEGVQIRRDLIWTPDKKIAPKIVPIIDNMEVTAGWETINDGNGSSINISSTPGKKGNGIQISYDLKEGGWVGISKEVDSDLLSEVAGLDYSYFSIGKQNTIGLRLVDDDQTTFGISSPQSKKDLWLSQKALYSGLKCLGLEKECNSHEKFDISRVKKLELIITNDPGAGDETGLGSAIIDEVRGTMAINSSSPWARAEQQRQTSMAFNLAAQSSEIAKGSSGDSLFHGILLAVESLRHSETEVGYTTLRNELPLLPRATVQLRLDSNANAAIFSPDGTKLATASKDHTARIWDVLTGVELLRLKHNGSVDMIAFSQDGTKLATASDDNSAHVWDLSTGKELFELNNSSVIAFSSNCTKLATRGLRGVLVRDAQTGEVLFRLNKSNNIAFSPDGIKLAVSSINGTASILDVRTGKKLFEVHHGSAIDQMVFTVDGKKLATISNMEVITDHSQHNIHIWDAEKGKELQRLNDDTARYIAISQDGTKLAAVCGMEGLTIRVWDVRTGEEIHRIVSDSSMNMIALSPDGNELALADIDNKASVWDLLTSKELGRFYHGYVLEDEGVEYVSFSPDGTKLSTASDDGTARIWDMRTDPGLLSLEHNSSVIIVAFNLNGTKLATASYDGTATIWDARTGREINRLQHNGSVYSLAFSPNGTKLATASEDKTARIWDVQTGRELQRLNNNNSVGSVVFSPDGMKLATTSSWDNSVHIWDTRTGQKLALLNHEGQVNAVAFSLDGNMLATASDDSTARIWDAKTGNELLRLVHDDSVNAVAFSPDGSKLATASNDYTARVWDVKSGAELKELKHDNWVDYVIFSPDGTKLATASEDNSARIWDVQTGRELQRLNHNNVVWSVVFSPDGTKLATASDDQTARIWDMQTGKELQRLDHNDWVKSVAFSPDGTELATACWDGTAKIWLISKGDLINKICSCLTSNMTREDWNRYLPEEDRITCPREGGSNDCLPCIEGRSKLDS